MGENEDFLDNRKNKNTGDGDLSESEEVNQGSYVSNDPTYSTIVGNPVISKLDSTDTDQNKINEENIELEENLEVWEPTSEDYENHIDYLRWVIKILKITIAIVVLMFLIYLIVFETKLIKLPFFENSETVTLTEKEEKTITELFYLMYNVNDVNDIITKNDAILSYFSVDLHEYIDVRDSKNFDVRYSEFSNEPISIDIESITVNDNGKILIEYSILSDFTITSKRIASIHINEDNIITYFSEYRVYPLFYD